MSEGTARRWREKPAHLALGPDANAGVTGRTLEGVEGELFQPLPAERTGPASLVIVPTSIGESRIGGRHTRDYADDSPFAVCE